MSDLFKVAASLLALSMFAGLGFAGNKKLTDILIPTMCLAAAFLFVVMIWEKF